MQTSFTETCKKQISGQTQAKVQVNFSTGKLKETCPILGLHLRLCATTDPRRRAGFDGLLALAPLGSVGPAVKAETYPFLSEAGFRE